MKNRYWDAITVYMNEDIREQVHAELAHCTAKEFLDRYLELDPDFQDILDAQFGSFGVEIALYKKQCKELSKKLAEKSRGHVKEWVAMQKEGRGFVFPASNEERFSRYSEAGYHLIASALDGNVVERF